MNKYMLICTNYLFKKIEPRFNRKYRYNEDTDINTIRLVKCALLKSSQLLIGTNFLPPQEMIIKPGLKITYSGQADFGDLMFLKLTIILENIEIAKYDFYIGDQMNLNVQNMKISLEAEMINHALPQEIIQVINNWSSLMYPTLKKEYQMNLLKTQNEQDFIKEQEYQDALQKYYKK